MNDFEFIKTQLKQFISVDKFAQYQHLQPAVENSTENDKKLINDEMNSCCNQLIEQTNKKISDQSVFKKIVRDSLDRIKDAGLDTEDEEFCYELYFQIGEILGIDIEEKKYFWRGNVSKRYAANCENGRNRLK